jgi:hypothetical protein
MATTITEINPITFETQTYSSQDVVAMSPEVVNSIFDPSRGSYVEYTILSPDNSFQITDQDLGGIIITSTEAGTGAVFNIDLDPERDLRNKGFANGEYNVVYKFLKNELNSSSDTRPYFIKEISPDRTELRLASNTLTNDELINIVNDFKLQINSSTYFQDFYLNFGSNNLIIANNILLDNTKVKYEVLINLYEPLPPQFRLKDVLWIVTQVANPLAFNIQFLPELVTPKIVTPTLKSPNFDLPIKNRTNNSTNYINYEQLLITDNITSYNQILSYLEEKNINISVDYTEFENFVHFSSAESRVKNFFYKIQLLERYSASLEEAIIANTPITSSVIALQNGISNIIKNFDGFEYYLYFKSGSTTYPKNSSTLPYTLYTSSNTAVQTWYTSSIKSASLFDEFNKDYLYNTIPEYLRDDPQNEPYKIFVDMIGQHYDNIWIYYKDVSNRYNGDNRLEYGVSKDLVADAIRSFGLNIYQNNFSVSDLFNAFTGFNSGSYLRTTNPTDYNDKEIIDTYYTASQESLYTPLDDVNKEMYKRIYHNLPYLLKSKGTVAGLQNIISMFGITSSILSISEFGGVYNNSQPITGIQDIVTDNIQILSSAQMSQSFPPIIPPNTNDANYTGVPKFILSSQKSILENYNIQRSLSPSVNTIEVTFSPQNDIDNYIISQGNFDIGDYIGIPSQTFLPYYPDLYSEADNILSGAEYSSSAYIRLIKYFDNSLFNMIKDFVPARTNLKSGITIKPHLLNRSKLVQPQVFLSSSFYTGSIDTAFIEGGTGGVFDEYNSLTPRLTNTQSWYETIKTPLGLTQSLHDDQVEFYNGELPYYPIYTTNGELNPSNEYKFPSTNLIQYNINVYTDKTHTTKQFIDNLTPGSGYIYAYVRTDINQVIYLKINQTSQNSVDCSDILPYIQNIDFSLFPKAASGQPLYGMQLELGTLWSGIYLYNVIPYYWNMANVFSNGVLGRITFSPIGLNFDYSGDNPIINNSFNNITSVHYMKVDYGAGTIVPYNFELLISGTADRASVHDSNYSSNSWSDIRYNGSRQSSIDFNKPY